LQAEPLGEQEKAVFQTATGPNALTPMAHLHAALAAFLFLGLLGTLKLMSRFESPT